MRVGLWRLEDVGLVDGSLEILHRDWLRKIVGGATVQRFNRGFCRSVCSEDDDGEIVSSASGLRQDCLTCNPSVALVTNDECEVCMVFQDTQAFFGCCSGKNGSATVVEGLFEQRSGERIGRDEQQDRRMHRGVPSPAKYWKQPTPLPAKKTGGP